MTPVGRLDSNQMLSVMHDAPEATVAAILTKQDEVIAKLNLILAAIEAATDAPSLFTGLDVTAIKTQLNAVVLHK